MREPAAGIPALTGLRGIAATWVLLFHIGNQTGRSHPDIGLVLDWIAGGGFLGVDLFFVLSGFVIALNYSGAKAPTDFSSYLAFLQKRLARIYPVHLFVLLIMVAGVGLLHLLSIPVARPWSRDAAGLVESALLLHGWAFPIRTTWNIPSWSVSTEWLAYLLFPLVSVVATRLPTRLTKLMAVAVLLCILPYVVATFFLRGTMAFGLPRIAVEFSLGVLLYSIWSSSPKTSYSGREQWMAVVLTLALGNYFALTVGEQKALMVAPILAGGLIWVLAGGGANSSCLKSSPAQYLGRISYSLYIVHGVWILFAQSLLRHLHWTSSTLHWSVAMTLVFAGSLASAHLLYTRIEEPARRFLSRSRTREPQDAAAPDPGAAVGHPHPGNPVARGPGRVG